MTENHTTMDRLAGGKGTGRLGDDRNRKESRYTCYYQ